MQLPGNVTPGRQTPWAPTAFSGLSPGSSLNKEALGPAFLNGCGRPLSFYLLLSTDTAGPLQIERQVHTVGERQVHTVGPRDVSGQSLHPSSFHSASLGTCAAPPIGLSCPRLPAPEAPVFFIFWELDAQWDRSP